ncbi:hypothetical protein [Roseitalea porphyridii]|uniref:Uncharacterized protein n=1 Tax=Roseitalea porphyridii TaxID=1852022 RepID=A0A4P6V0X4_9HYPH|nr:hypothetical protein [Roseitalea porphyridii]QBK30755.1 hypothetical protein E0E05_09205 [Roseitalea porphyridii]
MKRFVGLFSMLALLVVMAIPGSAFDGAAADTVHEAPITAADMADMMADCCASADGAMHHAAGACPMDCATGVPALQPTSLITDAGLVLLRDASLPEGLDTTRFRPPIAA